MTRFAAGLASAAAMLALMAALACTSSSSPPAAPKSSCPATIPAAGTSCPPDLYRGCEYGGTAHRRLTTLASCENGVWSISAPDPQTVETFTHGPECPATFTATLQATCHAPQACEFDDGLCECIACVRDAGDMGFSWFCSQWPTPTSACPSPRPYLGSSCEGDAHCSYETGCGAPTQMCSDGIWEQGTGGATCTTPACF